MLQAYVGLNSLQKTLKSTNIPCKLVCKFVKTTVRPSLTILNPTKEGHPYCRSLVVLPRIPRRRFRRFCPHPRQKPSSSAYPGNMTKVAVIIAVVAFCAFVAEGQSTLYPTNFAYPVNYGYPGPYPVNYGSPANFAYPPNPVYTINIFYPAHFNCPNHPAHHHNSTHPPNPNNIYPNSVTNPPNSVHSPTTTTHPNHHDPASATNLPKSVYSSTHWPNFTRLPYITSPNYQNQDRSTYQPDIRYPNTPGHATYEPDIAVASTPGLGSEEPPFEHSNNTESDNGVYPNNSTFKPNNTTEEPLGRICFDNGDADSCVGDDDVFDYGCHNLPDEARGFNGVITTFGRCFYLFEHPGCEGRRFKVGPGCYQDDCCPSYTYHPNGVLLHAYYCYKREDAFGYMPLSYMLC